MKNSSKSPCKSTHKIQNWKDYNTSLKKRGKITVWLSPSILASWRSLEVRNKAVGEKFYPDVVIEFCFIIQNLYQQPLRQTVGFVEDILCLCGLSACCVPNFSTLSRRSKNLSVSYRSDRKNKQNIHLSVDCTGIKVYGEGEWKVKKHGVSKHRTWLKLHIGIDVATQEIVCMSLTKNNIDDAKGAKDMITSQKIQPLSVRGDGAYDTFSFRALLGKEVRQIIPPPSNAVIQEATASRPVPAYLVQRNEAVERIKEVGRKEWKKEIGYHKRSLSETTMFRYKTIFGDKARTRKDENQETEAKIKCKILNVFTKMGVPKHTENFKK